MEYIILLHFLASVHFLDQLLTCLANEVLPWNTTQEPESDTEDLETFLRFLNRTLVEAMDIEFDIDPMPAVSCDPPVDIAKPLSRAMRGKGEGTNLYLVDPTRLGSTNHRTFSPVPHTTLLNPE
jgi:hypothetical protein